MSRKENLNSQSEDNLTIVYCDRNNTSDIWTDLKNMFDQVAIQTDSMKKDGVKDFRTVVLLPKMEPWNRASYLHKNPICPHLIYECVKRIFGRKDHNCLSAANKPKAVEVILKFAKLHDGFDYDDHNQIKSYFDDLKVLDFMRYSQRPKPLEPETIAGLIRGYNETPDNFGVPSDETINDVIAICDRQISLDLAE